MSQNVPNTIPFFFCCHGGTLDLQEKKEYPYFYSIFFCHPLMLLLTKGANFYSVSQLKFLFDFATNPKFDKNLTTWTESWRFWLAQWGSTHRAIEEHTWANKKSLITAKEFDEFLRLFLFVILVYCCLRRRRNERGEKN